MIEKYRWGNLNSPQKGLFLGITLVILGYFPYCIIEASELDLFSFDKIKNWDDIISFFVYSLLFYIILFWQYMVFVVLFSLAVGIFIDIITAKSR